METAAKFERDAAKVVLLVDFVPEQLVRLIFAIAHNYSNNRDITLRKWNGCV